MADRQPWFFEEAAGLQDAGYSPEAQCCHDPENFPGWKKVSCIKSLDTADDFKKTWQDIFVIGGQGHKIKKNPESIGKSNVST